MNATAVARADESPAASIVGVDPAKSVFQLAVADAQWRVREKHRLTRTQFERFFANRAVALVVMEACGSAHHWARWLAGLGIEVRLLHARYVRAYVRRNKTDAADAAALLQAARDEDLPWMQEVGRPVPRRRLPWCSRAKKWLPSSRAWPASAV